jgi:hypothetical protein
MAGASSTPADYLPSLDAPVGSVRSTALKAVAAPARFVAFWAAVALPFLYVPLLFGGLGGNEFAVFFGLLGLHLVALVVGHNHRNG